MITFPSLVILIPFPLRGHCILIASVDLRAFKGYGLD
jgi:hypothetical protein